MGRNLVKFKQIDDVISNSNVQRHNRHFDVATTKEVESLRCFFVFGWIKLKMQYQFEIIRKYHIFFS